VFNKCLLGPSNSGQDSAGAPDYTYITSPQACQFCFDLVSAIPGETSYMLICDQTIPFPPQAGNVTGYLGVCSVNYITTAGSPTHEGQLFSFAFARDLTKKYYQIFDSTLTSSSSGYVFPRDTLF
jgi:hypothetical protein